MVKCLYINHILNNFVLIKFEFLMVDNIIDDPPRPEDQLNRSEAILMGPTRGPVK